MMTTYDQNCANAVLEPLQRALNHGDTQAILALLPELDVLLPLLGQLPAQQARAILTQLLPVLPTEEDQWDIIEATAMDSVVRPERGLFAALIPHVAPSLHTDTLRLIPMLTSSQAQQDAIAACTAWKAI